MAKALDVAKELERITTKHPELLKKNGNIQKVMKRLLLIFTTIVMAASCGTGKKASSAEENIVQGEFLGCKFGDSPSTVVWRMGGRYSCVKASANEYIAVDRDFGGLRWDYVHFIFNSKRKLAKVFFSKHSNLEESAKNTFEHCATTLTLKYLFPQQSDDKYWSYTDPTKTRQVSLMRNLGESRGGKLLWYCTLSYTDNSYLTEDFIKAYMEL